MSLFKGESPSVSHISKLQGSEEPSLGKTTSLDHEEDDIPFGIVHKAHHLAGLNTLIPLPTLEPNELMPVGLESVASIVTREDVIQFRRMYGILNILGFLLPTQVIGLTLGWKVGLPVLGFSSYPPLTSFPPFHL